MMNETMIKKMEELLSSEEFAQKVAEAGSFENTHKLFVENGVDVTYEEFMAYLKDCRDTMVEKGLISEDGELSAELLEQTSGGNGTIFLYGGTCIGFGLKACATPIPGARVVGAGLIIGGLIVWGLDGIGVF